MLKLTVSPGEFIMIGDDIKIIFGGGDRSKIPVAIEAPRKLGIIRSTATKKNGFEGIDSQPRPYRERPLSDEAKQQITAIVMKDRWKNRQKDREDRKAGREKMQQAEL